MSRGPHSTRLPRHIPPGRRRASTPGSELDVLLVARSRGEWIGIDLASGAYLRLPHPGAEAPEGARPGRSVLRLTLGEQDPQSDPARPEAARPEGAPTLLAPPRRRATRRLLDSLTQADRPGAVLLGSRGPSIAYVDLNPEASSLVLVRAPRALEVTGGEAGSAVAAVHFGGVTQSLPLLDPPLRRAAASAWPRPLSGPLLETALGHRPGYLLVGLDAVDEGHVRKAVLAVLER